MERLNSFPRLRFSLLQNICKMNGWKLGTDKHSQVLDLFKELWAYFRVRKKYWLAPVIVIMVLFGGLIVLTQGSAVAPFIYTIF